MEVRLRVATPQTDVTAPGGQVDEAMLVVLCDIARDRHGHPYLRLMLRTVDGAAVEARWWRYPYPVERRPQVGQVCRVSGARDHFDGRPQIRVLAMRPAPDVLPEAFVGAARTPLEHLLAELEARVARLAPDLAALVRAVLADEVHERFCTWPAALARHGAVRHGLLEHTLRVAALAERLAEAYRGALAADADLVTAACLLHDVGKVYTLPELPEVALPEGAGAADHVTRGVLLVHTAAGRLDTPMPAERLERLTHALLAHHGRREWGAPVEPRTLEAWLVHLADYAESRLWDWSRGEP